MSCGRGGKSLVLGVVLFIGQNSLSAPFEELNTTFNRTTSHVIIRRISTPTLANLDYAAYIANPVLRDPQTFAPKGPGKKIKPEDCFFGGLLSRQCNSLKSTPLTPDEIGNPMAWEPLAKKIGEIIKYDGFSRLGNVISAEKWGDPSIFMPYQHIVALYVHGSGEDVSFWVKIEFEPWVNFLKGVSGNIADGYKEIYGKLVLDHLEKKTREAICSWIQSEYLKKELSNEEIVDWANVLASYWYPKFNTDIVDMAGQSLWPNDQTEAEIKNEISGRAAVTPLLVIRGNPFGEVIYNVFIVGKGGSQSNQARADTSHLLTMGNRAEKMDSSVSKDFVGNNLRFVAEIKENGDYKTWEKTYAEFRNGIAKRVLGLPTGQLGFIGKDGWLFFGKGIDYLNGGDLTIQPADKNPLPKLIEFQKFLSSSGAPLLFVVVPDKAEVYYDFLPGDAPREVYSIVNPYCRKFLKSLQDSGIEVVDLLPLFLAAKREDGKNKEGLFQKQDTHWSTRGLILAADAIGERIRRYGWYAGLKRVTYSVKDTVVFRQGDIVDKLADAERSKFPPGPVEAQQVFCPDGKLYKANDPSSPILLIGDSFTGVFELIDCKGAGVGAHIARKTGIPVEVVTSWGGGPLVRSRIVRTKTKTLSQKKVVIYMMAARDLYNYSQGWEPLP
jgi:hypothetical protein